ncbi:F-box/RNI/FBD-like domain protein [Medicago truncatula]|uniref:F-box/RNI/FBD-like domain protein n=1 Tax=Medicago truncatula TaxID=3880 RepID=G7JFT3_MEDTR|nr:F-box/RNI/FBD-like domain protein [Medicago truncatula]
MVRKFKFNPGNKVEVSNDRGGGIYCSWSTATIVSVNAINIYTSCLSNQELKRQRRENRISELPDCLLLHILSFLEARDAVRTCILSKRWKDLCKRLTTLTYTPSLFTSSYYGYDWYAKCPKSLHLPALRTLHLKFFNFVATHDHCAEPFSNCHVLNTLVISGCSLIEDAQVLCISNQTLSNLTISYVSADQFSLSTPNLSSFTIKGSSLFHQPLASTCNLSFLQQVTFTGMDGYFTIGEASIFLRWLQVFANVKILKVGSAVLETIHNEFRLNPISKKAQPPRFVRLELFIVYKHFTDEEETLASKQEIMEVVEHLLQNTTSMPRVDII